MNKQENIHDYSNTGVVMATIFTILPLIGIFIISNIFMKIILIIIILGVLQNYFFHPIWVNANKHGFVIVVILNMLWFSIVWFFYPHWIIFLFSFFFVFGLGMMKRILKKYYYE